MHLDFNSENKLKQNRFSKLGMWYILALSVIATIAVSGQLLIQWHLRDQASDSRVINFAGAQRYKSQEIVKMSMLLYADMDHRDFPDKIQTLEDLLEEWERGHYSLQHGAPDMDLPGKNSEVILAMFKDLEPHFQKVYTSAYEII